MAIKTLDSFTSVLNMYLPSVDASGEAYVTLEGRKVTLEKFTKSLNTTVEEVLKVPLTWRVRKVALQIMEKLEVLHEKARALTGFSFLTYFYQIFGGESESSSLKKLRLLSLKFCTYTTHEFHEDFGFIPEVNGSYTYCNEVCMDPDEEVWWSLKKEWLKRRLETVGEPLKAFKSILKLNSDKDLSFDTWGNPLVLLEGYWMKLDDVTHECVSVMIGMFAVQVLSDTVGPEQEIHVEEEIDRDEIKVAKEIVLQLKGLYVLARARMEMWTLISSFLPQKKDSPEQGLKRVERYLRYR